MDRVIVYPGQIPLETDVLQGQKNAMIGLAKLAEIIFGTSRTLINGLACTPTTPTSMQVNVAAGQIYAMESIDATAYSSLDADISHTILKQGIVLDATVLSCPAPTTSGYSINYLIEIGFSETDGDSTVLPYYNSSDPSVSYSGQNNSGEAQYTSREGVCSVVLKSGVAAATGSQSTPSPDSGYVGAWVITVAYGATEITSSNISKYSTAPFIDALLNHVNYGADTGAANAYIINPSFSLTSHVTGLPISFLAANTNTGASTVNISGLGAVSLKKRGALDLSAGDIAAGSMITIIYDGTYYQLVNVCAPQYAYAADTGSADAYAITLSPARSAHVVGLPISFKASNTCTGASTLNVNGLGAVTIKKQVSIDLVSGDIVSGQIVTVVYDGTYYQLVNNGLTVTSLSQFGSSLADSGYQKLPSGLIMQWGYVGAGSGISVTFPTSFTTACFVVLICDSGTGMAWFGSTNRTTTGYTSYSSVSTEGSFYIAIGY